MIESHQVTARPKPVVITVSCTVCTVHSTMNTAPNTMYKQYTQLKHRVVCTPPVVCSVVSMLRLGTCPTSPGGHTNKA